MEYLLVRRAQQLRDVLGVAEVVVVLGLVVLNQKRVRLQGVREPLVDNLVRLSLAAEDLLRELELRELVLDRARTRLLRDAELQLLESLPDVLAAHIYDLRDELIRELYRRVLEALVLVCELLLRVRGRQN